MEFVAASKGGPKLKASDFAAWVFQHGALVRATVWNHATAVWFHNAIAKVAPGALPRADDRSDAVCDFEWAFCKAFYKAVPRESEIDGIAGVRPSAQ